MADPTNPIEEPSGRRWRIPYCSCGTIWFDLTRPCSRCGNHTYAKENVLEVIPLADHEQAVRELRADLSTIMFLLTEGREANRLNALDRARSALARTGGQNDGE